MSALLAGLISAALWGVSDWYARLSSRAVGAFRAQWWSQIVGTIGLGLATWLTGEYQRALVVTSPRVWFFALLYAVLVGVAAFTFFDAFGRGKLVLVAPIVGSYGAVGVVLERLTGTRLAPITLVGLVLIVVGVIVASIAKPSADAPDEQPLRGVPSAFASALLFGAAFFILGKEVAAPLGPLVPVLLSRVIGPAMFVLIAIVWRTSLRLPPGTARAPVLWSGVLSASAAVVTALGSMGDNDSTVSVLGSMSVIVTMLISLIVLKERLQWHQWLGVALTLLGMPLLSIK